MSDKESRISIVNLSNYVQPEIKEVPSKKYVTYGTKNSYFQYLIDRSRGSATNGSVINSIIDMIYGKGLNDESFYDTIPEDDVKRLVNDLKRMGQCAIQLQYFGGRKSVKGSHIPVESLAAEKADKDGVINAYYHAKDWSKAKDSDLERIPTFESKEKGGIEILYIKPYNSGLFYYSTVDYQGGLQYAELEEEIGNYHINNIQNGLAPSMLINMNNGVPATEEKAREIERKIQTKYSGSSNAGRVVLMFNDNKDSESTITPIPLSDASEQYQFLSNESASKILVSHRVTSPLLFGLSTNTGFGSNAEELETASLLFESLVIKPFRQILIQGFDKINEINSNSNELEFISLNPFSLDEEEEDEEGGEKKIKASKETLNAQASLRGSVGGVQGILSIQSSVAEGKTSFDSAVSMLMEIYGFNRTVAIELLGDRTEEISEAIEKQDSNIVKNTELSEHQDDSLIANALIGLGEDEDLEKWELIDEREVDYLMEDYLDGQVEELNNPKLSFKKKVYNFVTTGTARPNAKSEQDGENSQGVKFKVRYQYAPLAAGENSRDFCKRMVTASKIYRKEDIIAMENQSVNPGWGLGGANNYSIWLYKGGGGCHHKWFRKTYVQRTDTKIDVKSPLAPTISTTKARQEGFRAPANDSKVSVAPVNMPNKGFVNK